jgi:hypothetical protein
MIWEKIGYAIGKGFAAAFFEHLSAPVNVVTERDDVDHSDLRSKLHGWMRGQDADRSEPISSAHDYEAHEDQSNGTDR